MFYNEEEFFVYLAEKKKGNIDAHSRYLEELFFTMDGNPPTPEALGEFMKKVWEKGLGAAKTAYQALKDYGDYCSNAGDFDFTSAYEEHIRQAFEEPVRKKMNSFKNGIEYIPDDILINSKYLGIAGLTNQEFVKAFKNLQEIVYNIYDAIENSSPFEWGWPDWQNLTVGGINFKRIANIFMSLGSYNSLDGDVMVVDRAAFFNWDWNKLEKGKSKATLVKMAEVGFALDGVDDQKAKNFRMSCPKNPSVMRVIYAIGGNAGDHMDYRKVQDPDTLPPPTTFRGLFGENIVAYEGVRLGNGFRSGYVFDGRKIAEVRWNNSEKNLRLWLKDIFQNETFLQELDALPNNIKSKFKTRNARKPCPCGECYKDRRNENVIEYTYEGKQYEKCERRGFIFKVSASDTELIPIFLRLLELEYGLTLKVD